MILKIAPTVFLPKLFQGLGTIKAEYEIKLNKMLSQCPVLGSLNTNFT